MTRSEVINAYKMENHPAGRKLNALTEDELTRIQGGGDVKPETTPAFGGGVALSVALSKLFSCGSN
ncbi:mersacidin family lantibiotic [Bacillus wiedmannii]|uniref:mersacidin family lantibiotic n=1 Tax=Bacillus wiedmannii TaxID=1890302 RepID=UPI000D08ACCF|nr:mersacidin family lantibiotic [Bacillus wiedmannii]PRT15281.1 type 2 lantibiotic [Bacillus wiedmannii]